MYLLTYLQGMLKVVLVLISRKKKSKQILKSSFFRETYLQGILGWDDQSQMISEAESPFSSTATSGLFKWFMYTAFNSSSREDANSGFGVFGGDLGLKKIKVVFLFLLYCSFWCLSLLT